MFWKKHKARSPTSAFPSYCRAIQRSEFAPRCVQTQERESGKDIKITSSAGSEGTEVTGAINRNVVRAIWMPNGKSLFLSGHDGARIAIWIQSLDSSARKIDLGDANPF
jgi:hypothetical protein